MAETTAEILIFGSVLVFLWAVLGLISPGLARIPNRIVTFWIWVLSVLMFIGGGALVPEPEPTRVDRTPPRTAPAPEPEMDRETRDRMRPHRQFGDWYASGTQAGIDSTRRNSGGFLIMKEDGVCTFLVSPPPSATGPYFNVRFQWNNGVTDLFELGIHRIEGEYFQGDFYALYDLPITPGYGLLMPRIRSMSSFRINGGPSLSLVGSADALDYLGC